jgi:DNA-binding transcriptional LysR family regulator
MDMNLLKTFLEVHRTRHFGRAGESLFLTQSAVSARIRLLEENLGVSLFDRRRKDMQLTPAGRRFLKHAEQLLQAWNRACRETEQGENAEQLLAVGGPAALWDVCLSRWLATVSGNNPDLSVVAEVDGSEALMRKLIEGGLDVAFLLEPPQSQDLANQPICRFPLILVATRPNLRREQALDRDYVMVDWGVSFNAQHERHFSDMPLPRLRVESPRVALDYIQARGGAAYMPRSFTAHLIEQERLFPVLGVPEMERQVLAVYALASRRLPLIEEVLRLFDG